MQVELDLTARWETHFNIGTGVLAGSVADRPLIKDAGGRPIIPGSSLKGRVRQECERIIRSLVVPWPSAWECTAPYPDRMCKGPDFCPVCRIFGAPWHPAPVVFGNLNLVLPAKELPLSLKNIHGLRATDIRFGNGINRKRGVVEENLLYSVEVYKQPPELVYRGQVWGMLPEYKEIALLIAGLRAVPVLGGSGSRGMGWWQLDLSLTVDGQPCLVDELLGELSLWLS